MTEISAMCGRHLLVLVMWMMYTHKSDGSQLQMSQKVDHLYKMLVIHVGIIINIYNVAFRAPAWKQQVVGSRMPEQLLYSGIA